MPVVPKRFFVYSAVCLSLLFVLVYYPGRSTETVISPSQIEEIITPSLLSAQLGREIQLGRYPDEYQFHTPEVSVNTQITYSIDQELQAEIDKVLRRWKPDFAAVAAIDAETGRILTLSSYSKYDHAGNLNLRSSFPAASIFKVVTAAAAIDLDLANKNTVVPFNGGYHTLYKKNVFATAQNRWTRRISLKQAFGKSVNTFFGKLGHYHIGGERLFQYAEQFGFNQNWDMDIPLSPSIASFDVKDDWSVVSAASGFTRDNSLSPLHGAMLAAAVVNDGKMVTPYLIEEVQGPKNTLLYSPIIESGKAIMSEATAKEMRALFQATVDSGTSRSTFRRARYLSKLKDLELGGKTGSLTGLNPRGRTEWFIGYAEYEGRKVALAALTVSEKKWRVKPNTLATIFFEEYIRNIEKQKLVAQNKANQ